MPEPGWWSDYNEIVKTAKYMNEMNAGDATEIVRLLEKPWEFTDLHKEAVLYYKGHETGDFSEYEELIEEEGPA